MITYDDYTITIRKSENAGFVAEVLEIPEVWTQAATKKKALEQIREAIEGYLEVCKKERLQIPQPIGAKLYSGQLRLRMPIELHRRLDEEAHRNKSSLNTWIITKLSS